MSRNNQQRRAARAKQRHRRGPTPGPGPSPRTENPYAGWAAGQQEGEAEALMRRLARLAAICSSDSLDFHVQRELTPHTASVRASTEALLVHELTARVAKAWEDGWQPRDLVHAATKINARVAGHAADLIVRQAWSSGMVERAPEDWLGQLRALGFDAPQPVGPWRPVTDRADDFAVQVRVWPDVLQLLKLLAELLPLQRIAPPPSQWGRRSTPAASSSATDRDRLLARIRALLAKAEGTDHAAEAETFTAKAQELMTRHAVDEALLRKDQQEDVAVETKRVHLQAPYTSVKAMLLGAVARPNRSRSIFFETYDMCMLVGTPLDVDHVEMLFTSLLIQATRAMTEAGAQQAGSFDRSRTFRRSFLTAYATRIGERLEEADRSTTVTYGAELVPVLQREADAVTAEFERLFPHTRQMSTGHLDPRGWHAGRAAADKATFTAGRLTA